MPVLTKRVEMREGPIRVDHDLNTTDLSAIARDLEGNVLNLDVNVSEPTHVTIEIDPDYVQHLPAVDLLLLY